MPDFEDKAESEEAVGTPALSSSFLIDTDEDLPISVPNAVELQGEEQQEAFRMGVTGNITSLLAPYRG